VQAAACNFCVSWDEPTCLEILSFVFQPQAASCVSFLVHARAAQQVVPPWLHTPLARDPAHL
jgi:hypothetical protein